MNIRGLVFIVKSLLAFVAVVIATQISALLADPAFGGPVNQLSPIYGITLGVLLIGGYRYLPALFLGALLPAIFVEENIVVMLSVPVAAMVSSALGLRLFQAFRLQISLERVRDALLVFCCGALVSPLVAVVFESAMLCVAAGGFNWAAFGDLIRMNGLGAAVGSVITLPCVLAWADPAGFRLGARRLLEVALWFATLLIFAHITFRNWAPTDVLLYPMELAIFPIMAWAAIRFGLRGVSAGVLALALLAACELLPVLGGELSIRQSTANVWIFVGIVAITSICLASVMTELRLREAQILENESRLSAFTEALPDIAFVLSKHGEFLDVFAASEQMKLSHGLQSSGSVSGQRLADIFDATVARGFLEVIADAIHSGSLQTYEYRLVPVAEEGRWFEARVTPVPVPNGESEQVVWVAYDITGRKEAEAAVQQRDQIMQATARANHGLLTIASFDEAVEAALKELGQAMRVDRVLIYERLKDDAEPLHRVSPRFEWGRDESIERVSGRLVANASDMAELFPDLLERLERDEIVETGKYDCLGAESTLVLPMWLEGDIYGFMTMEHLDRAHAWDESEISAARALASSIPGLILICQHEEELRVAGRQAHAASVAKGEFLAMMSHEIRIPMNAIIGYVDLLRQGVLDETQQEQTAIIKRSGRALMALINNVLDYSKIESQTLELEARRFDLEQVVCEALEAILPMAKEKGLKVDYELDEALGEYYVGDSHRLRQILLNLANNAVKFTETGSVTIRVSLEDSVDRSEGDPLHFCVLDTGCGIEADKFERIFQAFSQVDSSTTRQFGGTGLGLAISQRLVERMGGEIKLVSEPGQGSEFHFTISLPRPEQLSRTRAPFAPSSQKDERLVSGFARTHPLRILICEDDLVNRRVLAEMLKSLGYTPMVAVSAEGAIAEMHKRCYDVLLLDVQLPGVDGIELTQQIREGSVDPTQKDIYIIAITALAMNEDRESCIAAGMNDYLSKPVDVSLFTAALSKASATTQK